MSSKKIVCQVVVAPGATQWFGKLIVTDIRYKDGSQVTIQNFLGVTFVSPNISAPIQVEPVFQPWQDTSSEITNKPSSGNTEVITAKVVVKGPHTFHPADTLTWTINGNLTQNPNTYTDSFQLFADQMPGSN